MPDPRELKLAESAIRGSGSALDALWRTHRRWLAAVVLAHKPAEADAEDILQDVAAAVVDNIGSLREPGRFRAWLRSLAHNAAVSQGRHATVRRRHLEPLADAGDAVPDPSAGVDDQVDARDRARRTLEAIERLSPEERECLLLRSVQGMSQRAIAERLGVPVTTVESRIARARRNLRAVLAEPDDRALPLRSAHRS